MHGAAIFLAVFFAALRTACPTVAFDDTGEACLAALTLGVPHPPGYPVFTMATSLWGAIPVGSIAFRLNIFSALLTACASVLALSVFRRMGGKSLYTGMAVAFLTAMFSASWSQSGLGKGAVYALNLCISLGILRELWGGEKRAASLLTASLLFGIGLAHHWMSMVALAPVLAWMLVESGGDSRLRRIPLSIMAVLSGAGAYIFLVIRASAGPFLDWADPRTIGNLLFVLSRRQYLSFLPGEEGMTMGEKLSSLAATIDGAAPWPVLLVLALIGAVLLFRRSRGGLLSTLMLPLAVFVGLIVLVPMRPGAAWFLETYSIPAVALLVLVGGIGLEQVSGLAGPRKSAFISTALVAAFIAWNIPALWRGNDRSRDYYSWDLAENLAGHGEGAGLLFGSSDAVIFGNWYLLFVEGRTRLAAVPVPLLPMPWVATGFAKYFPGLRTPYPGPKVGAESVPALLRAWADANTVYPQWSFLTEPARAAFPAKRMVPDGWMYRIIPLGNKYAPVAVNRLRHLRLRGIFTPRLSADARQDNSIRPIVFSGLLTWGRGVMERDSRLALRAYHWAGMLAEADSDKALCTLELGNHAAFNQRYKKAEDFYRLAASQDPQLTVAFRNLAMLLLARQNTAGALELMRKITKEAPESEESRELLPLLRQLEKN